MLRPCKRAQGFRGRRVPWGLRGLGGPYELPSALPEAIHRSLEDVAKEEEQVNLHRLGTVPEELKLYVNK